MHTDDASIFSTGSSKQALEEKNNNYLTKWSVWLINNRLHLSITKTKIILFRSRNEQKTLSLDIKFDNIGLEQVKEQRFLGVWFNENTTWTTYVDKIGTQLIQAVDYISRI